MKKIFFLFICGVMLSACVKTPDSALDKPSISSATSSPVASLPALPERKEVDLSKLPILKPKQNPSNPIYYQIPELGIEFKLQPDLKDLIYIYSPEVESAYFSTSQLLKMDHYCAPEFFPLGLYTNRPKSKLTNDLNGGPNSLPNILKMTKADDHGLISAKEFSSRFIVFISPQAACANTEIGNKLQEQSVNAFTKLMPDLKQIAQ